MYKGVPPYDMIGYNDTMQIPHAFDGAREQLWSFGPLGFQTWNSIRALDFLQSLADVDPERLIVTGESGGGTQTFLLSAVDDRPKWSAPVNMISLIMQGGSPCENAPGLRVGTNNVEIAALTAPKPMLMVSATGDWTKNTPKEEFPAMKAIYELYDRSAYVETILIDAPHNYNRSSREAVYRFIFLCSGVECREQRKRSMTIVLVVSQTALMPVCGLLRHLRVSSIWQRHRHLGVFSMAAQGRR
ncbi:MAG: hypothetical protein WKF37_04245 [Bryobacteraceae bacterium]